jgi:hypothetical protein
VTAVVEHHPAPVHGPYPDSVALAMDAEPVYKAARLTRPDDSMRALEHINEGMILGALHGARVVLGPRERSVAGVLAEIQPEYVAVIVGWIERAAQAQYLSAAGFVMIRCCATGCTETAPLPAGSIYLCTDHPCAAVEAWSAEETEGAAL